MEMDPSFAKYKMLVFDLDGTLAQLGKGIEQEDIRRLKQLEEKGLQIVVCSGKPTYYLCGMLRQVGLKAPVMVGENGATFQFGVDLPPKKYSEYPVSEIAKQQIRFFGDAIDAACGGKVWYQPNEVQLTPFIREEAVFDAIQNIIDAHPEMTSELVIYRHVDCFDFIPNNINKMNGIRYLGDLSGIAPEEMISFGDGVNDTPMFRETGLSVAIGDDPRLETDLRFPTIGDALCALSDAFGCEASAIG